jgi:hypothetical protein
LVQFSHTNSDFDIPYIEINQKKFQIRPSLALLGFKNFILAKNWSQDPLFLVISFSSILDPSSEIFTGHVFRLFKLKFSVVTSCVLLMKKKYQKNKNKKSKNPKKQRPPKNREKRESHPSPIGLVF